MIPFFDGIIGGLVGAILFRIVIVQAGRKPRAGMVRMVSLCFTGRTVYGVDRQGRIWFVNMETGRWTRDTNPTEAGQ